MATAGDAKKVAIFVFASVALALCRPVETFAHGGGLDGFGCHHNRKAGGYHCHRGPLAGQNFSSKEKAMQAMPKTQGKESPAQPPSRNLPASPR